MENKKQNKTDAYPRYLTIHTLAELVLVTREKMHDDLPTTLYPQHPPILH